MEIKNKYVAIKSNINGAPEESDFEIKVENLSLIVEPESKEVIVKNLFLSIDPYQINRMKSQSSSQAAISFAAAIIPGDAIDTYGVGRVLVSHRPDFKKDDLVAGLLTWGEYTRVKEGSLLNKLEILGFPLSYHVGVFGFSGLAAYGGFFDVCKPKPGEKVFVSAASGSIGNLVGQYAKLLGCYVVGSAGSQEKVKLLKETLGFDDAFNYKQETDLKSALKRCFPQGIDVYFDNVGGKMLEAAVANMNSFGRVAVCGVISEYTNASTRAAPEMLDIVYKRITIQGFLAADLMKVYADFLSKTVEYLQAGKLKAIEDVSQGVESIPSAFIGLFRGDNIGKKIVKVADE
ncbi:NADP-dependent alkenal double bond reductase P2-like [Nicotiana tomentosiformis]|uniref:NADP-dependent alkenal double bond reductase P2-like n=1 Tax=Nicotiana tomentosiformis TaxID=4098 RepID=UPI00051C7C11|nr:NADP-dependent alkenal double bond reductase P2-like [Nicotiana tomentosiformis]XP_009623180.1 NADP-dependent alkenal double bond reductase P2-like [Nicotiana tomentosiformis]XP_009623181.1 NADP-dependent alkenal double bond reductase P2-like [Nicotiana tomentosiformis]